MRVLRGCCQGGVGWMSDGCQMGVDSQRFWDDADAAALVVVVP